MQNIDALKTKMADTIFHLEEKKGHLKWSVAQIAKSAKISRSLVYYHFGKTKKQILVSCLDFLGLKFYGLNDERKDFSLLDSLMASHQMYQGNPTYAGFYQKWRHRPGDLQTKYLEFEQLYDRKLKKTFPSATPAQRLALQGVFHGLVTAPFLDRKSMQAAVELLKLEELV